MVDWDVNLQLEPKNTIHMPYYPIMFGYTNIHVYLAIFLFLPIGIMYKNRHNLRQQNTVSDSVLQ